MCDDGPWLNPVGRNSLGTELRSKGAQQSGQAVLGDGVSTGPLEIVRGGRGRARRDTTGIAHENIDSALVTIGCDPRVALVIPGRVGWTIRSE